MTNALDVCGPSHAGMGPLAIFNCDGLSLAVGGNSCVYKPQLIFQHKLRALRDLESVPWKAAYNTHNTNEIGKSIIGRLHAYVNVRVKHNY